MSRAPSSQPSDKVYVNPTNNVYTVLVIVATLVNVICFTLMVMRYTAVFGDKANIFNVSLQH
jgi:hypothetical protein